MIRDLDQEVNGQLEWPTDHEWSVLKFNLPHEVQPCHENFEKNGETQRICRTGPLNGFCKFWGNAVKDSLKPVDFIMENNEKAEIRRWRLRFSITLLENA